MKESHYFQHDYGARNDPKLQEVVATHGMVGIGTYWCLVEQLYEQGGRIPIKFLDSLAFSLRIDRQLLKSLVNDFGLFATDGEVFWSESINARLDKRKAISERRRKAIQKRWNSAKTEKQEKSLQSECNSGNAVNISDKIDKNENASDHENCVKSSQSEQNDNDRYNCITRKEKERKEKERKEDPLPPMRGSKGDCKGGNDAEVAPQFCPPLVGEVRAYAEERGAVAFSAERFVAFYEAKGWMVGRNRMKSWQAAVRSWIARDRADERASGTSLTKTERNETVRASDERRASAERVVDVLLNGGV